MSVNLRFTLNGRRKLVYFSHGGSNLYKAEVFAAYLQQYSNAVINKVSIAKSRIKEGTPTPGEIGSVHLYAKLLIKDIDETGLTYAIILPAPDYDIFEGVDDKNRLHVLPAIGEGITQAYIDLADLNFEYKDGYLCGSSV